MQLLIPSRVGAKSTRAGVDIATDAGVGTPQNDDVPRRNTIYIIYMYNIYIKHYYYIYNIIIITYIIIYIIPFFARGLYNFFSCTEDMATSNIIIIRDIYIMIII